MTWSKIPASAAHEVKWLIPLGKYFEHQQLYRVSGRGISWYLLPKKHFPLPLSYARSPKQADPVYLSKTYLPDLVNKNCVHHKSTLSITIAQCMHFFSIFPSERLVQFISLLHIGRREEGTPQSKPYFMGVFSKPNAYLEIGVCCHLLLFCFLNSSLLFFGVCSMNLASWFRSNYDRWFQYGAYSQVTIYKSSAMQREPS